MLSSLSPVSDQDQAGAETGSWLPTPHSTPILSYSPLTLSNYFVCPGSKGLSEILGGHHHPCVSWGDALIGNLCL